MKLTLSQVQLLRHIQELPQASRITNGSAPAGCAELATAGYVRIVPVNISDLLTEITDEGQRALIDWEEDEGSSITGA
jgi:hypothetical protein